MPKLASPPRMALAARARPRRVAGAVLLLGLALAALGVALGGAWSFVAYPLAVTALGVAYCLELRRLWAAAHPGSDD